MWDDYCLLSDWHFISLLFNQCLLPSKKLLILSADIPFSAYTLLSKLMSLFASTGHVGVAGDTATSLPELFWCYCDVLLWYFGLSVNPSAKAPEHPVIF